MASAAPISIIHQEQSLVLQGGAPARIEIAHESGTEIVIERSDVPGPAGEGAATETISRIASQALGGFRVVRVDANNQFALCDASAPECANACGLTIGAAAQGAIATAQSSGEITEAAWNWNEGPVYCGAAGTLTQLEPQSGTIVEIGRAAGPKSIRINPNYVADLA